MEMSNQTSDCVKLIEVKTTSPAPAGFKMQKTQEQIDEEELQMMIKAKLSLFDDNSSDGIKMSSNGVNDKSSDDSNSVGNNFLAKLNKFYKNEESENKQKITEMVDLFNAEVIVAYQKVYADTIKLTSKHTINEFLSEINTERAKLADVLVNKNQVMTKEY